MVDMFDGLWPITPETTFDVASKQIESGQTVQITDAFQLINTTDPVEIQFNNLHHDDVQTITVDLSKSRHHESR